jgi:hypothetical protein
MANLDKSNVSSGNTIQATDVSNLYDTLTGTTAYDNIGLAKFTYLNAGGTFGNTGYGFKNNGGTIQFRNNGGSWADVVTAGGGGSPGGSQHEVQINDGSSGFTASSKFSFNSSTVLLKLGNHDGSGNDTYISMSDSGGGIHCSALGLATIGDYEGRVNGTYISVDDVNEIIRVQCEGVTIIGDDDWSLSGNSTHMEINDSNSQISMSAANGVIINAVATGTTVDVGADANGTIQVNTSDYRLKENVKPIVGALDKVLNLKGVNFEWIDKESRGHGKQIGMIAQQVQKHVPEVVFEKDDVYGMNYSPLVSLLVEAIKDQQPQIDELKQRLDKLERR